MKLNLQDQLAAAIAARQTQDSAMWAIFGAFWPTNAIFLVALFGGAIPTPRAVGLVVSGAGFGVAVLWWLLETRAVGHVRRYLNLMERIEREMGVPPHLAVSAHIEDAAGPPMAQPISALKIMLWCVVFVGALWAIAVLYFWTLP